MQAFNEMDLESHETLVTRIFESPFEQFQRPEDRDIDWKHVFDCANKIFDRIKRDRLLISLFDDVSQFSIVQVKTYFLDNLVEGFNSFRSIMTEIAIAYELPGKCFQDIVLGVVGCRDYVQNHIIPIVENTERPAVEKAIIFSIITSLHDMFDKDVMVKVFSALAASRHFCRRHVWFTPRGEPGTLLGFLGHQPLNKDTHKTMFLSPPPPRGLASNQQPPRSVTPPEAHPPTVARVVRSSPSPSAPLEPQPQLDRTGSSTEKGQQCQGASRRSPAPSRATRRVDSLEAEENDNDGTPRTAGEQDSGSPRRSRRPLGSATKRPHTLDEHDSASPRQSKRPSGSSAKRPPRHGRIIFEKEHTKYIIDFLQKYKTHDRVPIESLIKGFRKTFAAFVQEERISDNQLRNKYKNVRREWLKF